MNRFHGYAQGKVGLIYSRYRGKNSKGVWLDPVPLSSMGQAFNGMEIGDLTCQRQNGNGNVGAGFEPARHCNRE